MPFNRRGHDSVSTYDSRDCVGGAYQTVAEGIEDNEIAAKYLAGKGFTNPIVIGHSNGGVLASEHVARHPETRALILLSAHAGGNRMANPRSARNFSLAGDTDELKKHAEALVAAGKPRQLMLIPAWWWVISARTYLDRLTNAPDLVENAKRITCPVLIYPRRPGADGKLSGGTIQRKLRRPVRDRDHPQLRPLLRRRGRSGSENGNGLAEANARLELFRCNGTGPFD